MADYQASAEKLGGGQIRAAGWTCHYDRYSRELGGWSLRCERGGQTFTWNFTP